MSGASSIAGTSSQASQLSIVEDSQMFSQAQESVMTLSTDITMWVIYIIMSLFLTSVIFL